VWLKRSCSFVLTRRAPVQRTQRSQRQHAAHHLHRAHARSAERAARTAHRRADHRPTVNATVSAGVADSSGGDHTPRATELEKLIVEGPQNVRQHSRSHSTSAVSAAAVQQWHTNTCTWQNWPLRSRNESRPTRRTMLALDDSDIVYHRVARDAAIMRITSGGSASSLAWNTSRPTRAASGGEARAASMASPLVSSARSSHLGVGPRTGIARRRATSSEPMARNCYKRATTTLSKFSYGKVSAHEEPQKFKRCQINLCPAVPSLASSQACCTMARYAEALFSVSSPAASSPRAAPRAGLSFERAASDPATQAALAQRLSEWLANAVGAAEPDFPAGPTTWPSVVGYALDGDGGMWVQWALDGADGAAEREATLRLLCAVNLGSPRLGMRGHEWDFKVERLRACATSARALPRETTAAGSGRRTRASSARARGGGR
jgi:hypothetical protein